MLKILFVCHGNICRSPMAEFILRDMLEKRGINGVETASAATSAEEIGNPVHRGTARILDRLGIDYSHKRARQITKADAEYYDMLIGMDGENLRNMRRVWKNADARIFLLGDFSSRGEISDPWYTGDFERTYLDVKAGCEGLVRLITDKLSAAKE